VFGDYPINAVRREHVSDWLGRMKKASKSHSTLRNALFLVRMVLRYAADEKWIPSNPAADVKLPRSTSVGEPGVVDDPAQFLTAAQVAALANATRQESGLRSTGRSRSSVRTKRQTNCDPLAGSSQRRPTLRQTVPNSRNWRYGRGTCPTSRMSVRPAVTPPPGASVERATGIEPA
jgi:hypothetical protein